jgi:hypothetical protein
VSEPAARDAAVAAAQLETAAPAAVVALAEAPGKVAPRVAAVPQVESPG